MTSTFPAYPFGQPAMPGSVRQVAAPGAGPDDTAMLGPRVFTPPPLGARQLPPGADDRDPLNVSIRNQAIDRLEELNRNHTRLAFEAKGTPICPHAIAFLYLDAVETDPARTWRKVVAAVRVVPNAEDVRELPSLLNRLGRLAEERYLPAGGFDPAIHMTQSELRDRTSGPAEYIGIAVSTLDTPTQRWEVARAKARDTDDLGGRAYIMLADNTAMLVDRPPFRVGGRDLGVHSTGDLRFPDSMWHRMYVFHPNVATMPADREVWERMHFLHQLIYRQNPRPTL